MDRSIRIQTLASLCGPEFGVGRESLSRLEGNLWFVFDIIELPVEVAWCDQSRVANVTCH